MKLKFKKHRPRTPSADILIDGKTVGEITAGDNASPNRRIKATIHLGLPVDAIVMEGFGDSRESAIANAIADGMERADQRYTLINGFAHAMTGSLNGSPCEPRRTLRAPREIAHHHAAKSPRRPTGRAVSVA